MPIPSCPLVPLARVPLPWACDKAGVSRTAQDLRFLGCGRPLLQMHEASKIQEELFSQNSTKVSSKQVSFATAELKMALLAQKNSSSRKWVVLSACLLLAIVVVFASLVLPSAEWPAPQALGTRRKAPPSRLFPDQEHFETLTVTVVSEDAADAVDDDDRIGGDVDYGDYGNHGGDDPAAHAQTTEVAEEAKTQEDYEEEDISEEDQDAEESAEYDTEDLDDTDLVESVGAEDASTGVEKDGDNFKKEMSSNLRDYDLTKERATQIARQADGSLGPVVVTWANYHYLDFALNWVHHMRKTGCQSFLVGAMDDELLEVLLERGVPAFGMSSGLSLEDFGWGSSTFHKMGREKISLLQMFTRWNLDVLISDVDTVWLKDPLPYVARYPKADILISSDHLSDTTGGDGGLEHYPQAGSAANIGVMLFRPAAARFVDHWMEALDNDPAYWDQNAFNDLFKIGMDISDEGFRSDKDRLFKVYNETLRMGILPVSMFCSGHTYFVQDMPSRLGVDPYVIHATFQYSGTSGKRNRFRERLLWDDPDDYFRHPVGYLSAEHRVSDRLLDAAQSIDRDSFDLKTTMPHFRLVNQQLETVRALLALAKATKRALVMPKLFCGLDRWWAPHDGNIPGADGPQLPFICPLDHVFELDVLQRDGGMVEWKESSFLDNPKARSIKSRKLSIITCNELSQQCDDGSRQATLLDSGIVKLRAQRTDGEIERALSGIAEDFDLIEVDNPSKLWKGFESHEESDLFKQQYSTSTSLWCCAQPPDGEGNQVGHVWYDILAGSNEDHSDRWGRWIDMSGGEWIPQLGP